MRRCDLIGQKFGKLTVIDRLDESSTPYQMWLCRCDCGGVTKADTKSLKRGTIKNCGCIPKSSARKGQKAEDLTGRRFGKLVVVSREPNQNGRVCWKCRCDCGREHVTSAQALKAGKCTNCGCEWHKPGKHYADLTGQQFGELTALFPTERRSKKGSVYWHCRCSCKNEVDVTEDSLRHGQYKSCGCRKKELGEQLYTNLTMVDGTCVEILEKRKFRSDNTSGFRGVYQKKNGKYLVSIGFKGSRYYLGTYHSLEEAVRVRLETEKQIHGGFLNAYHSWKQQAAKDPAWGEANPLYFEVEKVDGKIQIITNM